MIEAQEAVTVQEDTLDNTFDWFVRARPNPTSKDFSSQLGVHFEEIGEMIDELSTDNKLFVAELASVNLVIKSIARKLKASDGLVYVSEENRKGFLDSLLDQLVTATGVGYTQNMQIVPALAEVNRSNFSKFDDDGNPIYDENRKVIKGPNYSPAVLDPFI